MILVETISDISKITGSSLSGYLNTSYQTLVELFGEPNAKCDGYKTDAEWYLSVKEPGEPKRYITVYNYKTGKNYCGEDGLRVEDIKDWHVGSKDSKSFWNLEQYIEDHPDV